MTLAAANHAIVSGRLTRDPVIRESQAGKVWATFSIAVETGTKDSPATSFFDAKCFGRAAHRMNEHGAKGASVLISGRIVQERWEKGGQQRAKTVLVADDVTVALFNGGEPAQPHAVNRAHQTREQDAPAIVGRPTMEAPF